MDSIKDLETAILDADLDTIRKIYSENPRYLINCDIDALPWIMVSAINRENLKDNKDVVDWLLKFFEFVQFKQEDLNELLCAFL